MSIPKTSETDTVAIRRPLPANTKYADEIIKALLELKKNGKSDNTQRSANYSLRKLTQNVDGHDPQAIKLHIEL